GALAGASACDERFENGSIGGRAGRNIDDREADTPWSLWTAGDRGEAAFRLDQKIVGLALRQRSAVAVAGDGACDQLGMRGAERRRNRLLDRNDEDAVECAAHFVPYILSPASPSPGTI